MVRRQGEDGEGGVELSVTEWRDLVHVEIEAGYNHDLCAMSRRDGMRNARATTATGTWLYKAWLAPWGANFCRMQAPNTCH